MVAWWRMLKRNGESNKGCRFTIPAREYGFSLIEILIAVFVLALGVIGAAGMQLMSLRTTQQSAFQTAALQLASEMADKMRANASQMKLSDAQNPFLAVNYKSVTDPVPEPPSKQCYTAQCSSDELAGFDIYELQQKVKDMLPAGRVVICRDAHPWDESAKALAWDCDDTGDASVVIKLGWQEKAPNGALLKDANQQILPGVALTVQPYVK
jgi:type IV pilus assembly protein PilV